jgi:hypothetical protein
VHGNSQRQNTACNLSVDLANQYQRIESYASTTKEDKYFVDIIGISQLQGKSKNKGAPKRSAQGHGPHLKESGFTDGERPGREGDCLDFNLDLSLMSNVNDYIGGMKRKDHFKSYRAKEMADMLQVGQKERNKILLILWELDEFMGKVRAECERRSPEKVKNADPFAYRYSESKKPNDTPQIDVKNMTITATNGSEYSPTQDFPIKTVTPQAQKLTLNFHAFKSTKHQTESGRQLEKCSGFSAIKSQDLNKRNFLNSKNKIKGSLGEDYYNRFSGNKSPWGVGFKNVISLSKVREKITGNNIVRDTGIENSKNLTVGGYGKSGDALGEYQDNFSPCGVEGDRLAGGGRRNLESEGGSWNGKGKLGRTGDKGGDVRSESVDLGTRL